MPVRKPLTTQGDLVYGYDGSLAGLYCCVHEAVYTGRRPLDILNETAGQASLLPCYRVETDQEKALRVRQGLESKVSPRAVQLAETVFCSCLAQKELALLDFMLMGFEQGSQVPRMLTDPLVSRLVKAEKHLTGEAHLLKGFLRFSDREGALVATIGPKNFILPFIAPHFVDRYANETFLIHDKTHGAALIYQDRRSRIVPVEGLEDIEVSAEEAQYRALWKHFYQTVGIAERENPRCRMSHMPKRYWQYMTEMKEFL